MQHLNKLEQVIFSSFLAFLCKSHITFLLPVSGRSSIFWCAVLRTGVQTQKASTILYWPQPTFSTPSHVSELHLSLPQGHQSLPQQCHKLPFCLLGRKCQPEPIPIPMEVSIDLCCGWLWLRPCLPCSLFSKVFLALYINNWT